MRVARAGLVPYHAMWIEFARGDVRAALGHLEAALGWVVDRPEGGPTSWYSTPRCPPSLATTTSVRRTPGKSSVSAKTSATRCFSPTATGCSPSRPHIAGRPRRPSSTFARPRLTRPTGGTLHQPNSSPNRPTASTVSATVPWPSSTSAALRTSQDGEPVIAMAEAALLARHGDPYLAEERLLAAPGHRVDPREYWRITLLRLRCVPARRHRRWCPGRTCFRGGGQDGFRSSPYQRRPDHRELLALAAETGQPAALALDAAVLPLTLSLLGRFAIMRGGRPFPWPRARLLSC